ncbi:hypothetical protein ABZ912_05270 [Nonomuraea angiospora]|uniref:hypothetical protein n=1 Tax=Nonomuraea angiospora TaxID=46172 RepID=UPI0033D01433
MTQQQPMTLTDWRGNPYTIGTTIFYPRGSSGSIEIQEGVVLDIWEAVHDVVNFTGWVRFDPENPAHQAAEEKNRANRVKVQPTGRSSRPTNYRVRRDEHGEVVRDDSGRPEWEQYDVEHKPVTLLIVENVTVADAGGTRA